MGLAYVVPSLLVIVNYLVIWHHVKRSASYLRQQGCVKLYSIRKLMTCIMTDLFNQIHISIACILISDLQMKFGFKTEK